MASAFQADPECPPIHYVDIADELPLGPQAVPIAFVRRTTGQIAREEQSNMEPAQFNQADWLCKNCHERIIEKYECVQKNMGNVLQRTLAREEASPTLGPC